MSDLHLCVGFYPNGDYKTNTVSTEHLQANIDYNKEWRPGRFYFVDGKHVCGGLFKEPNQTEFIKQCEKRIKESGWKPDPIESEVFV